MENESRLPRGSSNVTSETASEMLRTANQLLQVALQLLQQGQHVQGVESKDAQVEVEKEEPEVSCVSVACQTELEPEGTTVSGASWGVAQLKALLEEEMVAHNDSSGYGSDLSSSLDEEESNDDISSESGVDLSTSSPCEGLMPVCESTQLVLDMYDEEQQEEEQQEVEVSSEEELPCVPVSDLAACESCDGGELTEAPVTPHPLLGALGVLSGLASCRPGPINPDLRVRPPNLWGPADDELEPWPSLFWLASCSPSQPGPCCGWGAQSS